MSHNDDSSISLNKFISSTGICSRREADKMIEKRRVKINKKIAILGNRVFPNDKVSIDGKLLKPKAAPLYIAYNKPIGVVCTTDPKEPQNIIKKIRHKKRLFPIGRLDKPSEGLIFLTNDGDIVNKILRAGNNHEKEYIVTVDKPINNDFLQRMSNGIPIMGTITKKCKVSRLDDYRFRIVLTQGMNRQIRRMCEYLNYDVIKLKRTRIMNVKLGKLKIGEYRKLTKIELQDIGKLVSGSIKTEEASTGTKRSHSKPKVNPKGEGNIRVGVKPTGKRKGKEKQLRNTPKKRAFRKSK